MTLSTGEIIEHPREFAATQNRLGQAQRGSKRKLAARLHERIKNQRKDRNHKLSRRLVAEFTTICLLKDSHRAIAKKFGKSVSDSAHGRLRQMLAYKSLIGGTQLVFPENRNSTRACSTCGALTGPTGLAGLKVRQWTCGVCGLNTGGTLTPPETRSLPGPDQPTRRLAMREPVGNLGNRERIITPVIPHLFALPSVTSQEKP